MSKSSDCETCELNKNCPREYFDDRKKLASDHGCSEYLKKES